MVHEGILLCLVLKSSCQLELIFPKRKKNVWLFAFSLGIVLCYAASWLKTLRQHGNVLYLLNEIPSTCMLDKCFYFSPKFPIFPQDAYSIS